MLVKLMRRHDLPDGSGSLGCEVELVLDDALTRYPETLRKRLADVRQVLEQFVTPEPAAEFEPEPPPVKSEPEYARSIAMPPRSRTTPATGAELYDWARARDRRSGTSEAFGFLKALGRSWKHPERILDWSAEQVAAAYHEALAKLDRGPGIGSTGAIAPAVKA